MNWNLFVKLFLACCDSPLPLLLFALRLLRQIKHRRKYTHAATTKNCLRHSSDEKGL